MTGTNLSSYSSTASIYINAASPYTNSYSYNTVTSPSALTVHGDINFNGVSLRALLENIQDRLNIVIPDPNKLEKYQALREAYEHYRLLEKLLTDE